MNTRVRRGVVASAIATIATMGASMVALASNDPLYGEQWALMGAPASVNAPQAWCASLGDGKTIADIDSGADVSHPDFARRIIATANYDGSNGQYQGTSVTDDVGHGTMTLGLMAGGKDDGVTIAGMAPRARLLVAKVLHSDGKGGGTGSTSNIAAAIDWAVRNGANVINLSLGTNEVFSNVGAVDPMGPAIASAENQGVAVAVAAGNSGLPVGDYARSGALIVGALGRDGSVASYSNSLVGVNIYAPGGDFDSAGSGSNPTYAIVSDFPGASPGQQRYARGVGTSFAAPYVAGALALLMSRGLDNKAAQQRILDTKNSATLGLDAAAALGTSNGCASAPPTTNDPATSPGGGSGGTSGGGPGRRAPSGSRAPATGNPGPPVALATGTPTAAASATASSSATSTSTPAGSDAMPSPKSLAHPPAQPPSKGTSGALIAAGLAVAAGAAYGAFRLLQSLR